MLHSGGRVIHGSVLCLLPMLSAGRPCRAHEPAVRPGTVTIYTEFARRPSALSVQYMRTELEAIMAPLGLHFDWRPLGDVTGHQVQPELVVVRFQGECQSEARLPLEMKAGPLGWTHVSDGEILSFTNVDCDRIRDLMTSPLVGTVPAERARVLGRAMARVLAHELYHCFTNTDKHSASGIAKASFTGAELAAACLRFEEAQLDALREALHLEAGASSSPR